MNAIRRITTPLVEEVARQLNAGERILLSGVIWTGRDQAHKRLVDLLDAGKPLPVELKDQILYFVGPCPAPPGRPIGSAGPTTSSRMDAYSPRLLNDCGLRGMIGKGARAPQVIDAMQRCGAVYFAATGGAGALIARCIRQCRLIAFPELGTEAIYRLEVENFPLVVAIDANGASLYR